MSSPAVHDFLFDDDNEHEFARHGVSSEELLQVLENRYIIQPNRRRRRGIYLIIGVTNGGSCLAIPLEPTHDPEVWRPLTAWPCKESEAAKLSRA
jgi:uncharacterized DUF497 family protein